jgi:hypothetical protein
MTDWKSIDTAPRNGRPVLLWARLKTTPPGEDDFYAIVGFWHRSIQRWKVSPEHLNREEDLIASHWAPLPEPPTSAAQS